MSRQSHRLPSGGRIDRSRPIRFTAEGRAYEGYEGDTLASALLANGVRVAGRSFKHHRPRGIMAAGVEEPNALMQVVLDGREDANLKATEIPLREGLVARAVNCWPNARLDVAAVNGLLGRFIPAGFYYKTFLWPSWELYETFIRRAAGLGRAPAAPDPDAYEHRHGHCDVLVVGGGAAGLAAARAAAAGGARVILCEQDQTLGGRLAWEGGRVDGQDGEAWVASAAASLRAHPEVRVLTSTQAVGGFDHNAMALVEVLPGHAPRMRLWQIRAREVILATGALERPLVFPGNDRPGVMLAGAALRYLRLHAVRAGRQVVVFTNNDEAHETAAAYTEAGAQVTTVDSRTGALVVATHGGRALKAVTVREADGREARIPCDLLAMSGGFTPSLQLFIQAGGRPAYDDALAGFVPEAPLPHLRCVGAAEGVLDLAGALGAGHAAGAAAARAVGLPGADTEAPAGEGRLAPTVSPLWRVEAPGKAFVDFQNDVTADDIALAAREGFVSVEHLKRYTTLGMATDQGKTANVNALAIMAGLAGRTIAEGGITRDRFPYTPVPLGLFAGAARGELFRPLRRLPLHEAHAGLGARFEDYGGWLRPVGYPRRGESHLATEQREARAVRERAGLFDASPLGKIEVAGPDAGRFLDRIYANAMSSLKVGRVRYGLMLNELGVVIDDGVCARLGEDRFLLSTTGAGAERIAAWLDEWRQCEWRDLQVLVAPITTAWTVLTLSGPKARDILARAGTDIPLAPADFPHMAYREGVVAGLPTRVFRVSFTGEVSYEIHAPAARAGELWASLAAAGAPDGLEPVGVEAWMLLRTEKGYLHVGADTDGATSPADVGWGQVLKRKTDFVGRRSLTRPENLREDRLQFVGLEALTPGQVLPIGAHLLGAERQGYVTSSGYSPVLGRGVALGMVRSGRARLGETVTVGLGGRSWPARITAPGAYDPEGARLNG